MERAPITVRLSPGKHKIQAGYDAPTKSRIVTIKPGKVRRVEMELD